MSIIENITALWASDLPQKTADQHKYDHGHALIYGAPELTGATRLAATSCARSGVGMVSVLSDKAIVDVYRCSLPASIIVRDEMDWMNDRVSARLYGSGGLGVQPDFLLNMPTVLDAAALDHLPDKLSEKYVLTPHEGEFARAFPNITGTKEERALKAAAKISAIVILKGHKTVIASPDGECVINYNAPPTLATAGTGDVLAGLVAGLLAQGMEAFQASCAAVWIHGECANRIGHNLIADDLLSEIPCVMQSLYDKK